MKMTICPALFAQIDLIHEEDTLQEIGFLVTVANRHQIVYIRDQNLLLQSYET